MKRILLIKPGKSGPGRVNAPPMGLLYLAAYIRRHLDSAYEIKIIDTGIDNMDDRSLFHIIKEFKPDVAGLSVCSDEGPRMHKIAKMVKDAGKSTLVITGGPHPTAYHECVMEDPNIDIAVIGEGEITFFEILKQFDVGCDISSVKGIAWRGPSGYRLNEPREFIQDLDELPFPALDLIEIEKYSVGSLSMNVLLAGKKYTGLVTSRGCPFRCIYCHNIFGFKFRSRSPENVFAEIKYHAERYGVDEFHIFDDIVNFDKERLMELCDLISGSSLGIKLAFPNGLRGDMLDKKALVKLKMAGAYMVTFALESASERIQKLIKKQINREKILENINFADRIGLITKCFFMLGFPAENMEEIKATIDFACRSPLCLASFFMVTPQENTELFELAKRHYPDFNLKYGLSSNYYTENEDYQKALKLPLKRLQQCAYGRFYFNPTRLMKLFFRIPRKSVLFKNFRMIISFFLR